MFFSAVIVNIFYIVRKCKISYFEYIIARLGFFTGIFRMYSEAVRSALQKSLPLIRPRNGV